MNTKTRFALGIILLIIGSLMPLGGLLVTGTGWPIAVKAAVGGFCFFGFEMMLVPAVAIMGKENYDLIIAKVRGWIRCLKPAGNVSRTRHTVGIILFLLPIVPTYIMGYVPAWLPDASPMRLYVSIASDIVFLTSLFVLGGDFWDKLRALFVRDARAWFPGESNV